MQKDVGSIPGLGRSSGIGGVFPDNSVGEESVCSAGDPGLIPGPG